jgi:hypothetical protein
MQATIPSPESISKSTIVVYEWSLDDGPGRFANYRSLRYNTVDISLQGSEVGMSGAESLVGSSAGSVAVIALVLALLALGGVVVLLARQQRLLGQYQHLMAGTSGGNLETVLNDHVGQVRETTARIEAVDQLARRLEKDAHFKLQHMGVVRFNPFHDTGGDQSFAIALADGYGNGVILSSLHARDVTRVYAKPLQQWGSTYSLTDEEKQAIALASQKHS